MKKRATNKELRDIPQPPFSPNRVCPRCGGNRPRRTHETTREGSETGVHFTLCRCTDCWAVFWAANVEYLEID